MHLQCWLVVSARDNIIYIKQKLRVSVISPPILLGGSGGANFGDDLYQYLVSTSLIVSGLLSVVQMFRFHIKGTKYYIGTGLLSVVGRSFPSIFRTPASDTNRLEQVHLSQQSLSLKAHSPRCINRVTVQPSKMELSSLVQKATAPFLAHHVSVPSSKSACPS